MLAIDLSAVMTFGRATTSAWPSAASADSSKIDQIVVARQANGEARRAGTRNTQGR